jgi:hypothetical protein
MSFVNAKHPSPLSPRISCENNLSRTCRLGGRPFDWVSAIQPNNRSYKMQNAAMRGDKIYDVELDITGVTDYGVSMDAILAGQEAIPLHGARFDLAVDGRFRGRLAGRAHGVDYLRVRADGRIELDLHVIIETEDGHRIALSGDGQAAPRPGEPVLDIFANVRLSTASKDYAWVNERQIWGVGTASLATGKILVEGFMQ